MTRDLGMNIAGVEVILSPREKLAGLEAEVERLMRAVRREAAARQPEMDSALVPLTTRALVKR